MNCDLEIQDRVFLPKQGKPSYSGRGTWRLKFIFDGINMYVFCVSAVWDEGNYTDIRCDKQAFFSEVKIRQDRFRDFCRPASVGVTIAADVCGKEAGIASCFKEPYKPAVHILTVDTSGSGFSVKSFSF